GTLPWRELLRASAIDRGRVDVALLVHAHAVHTPEGAREIAPHAPRVQELPIEAVFEELRRAAIGGPQEAIARDDEHVDVRDPSLTKAPLVEILPVLVEHLHTAVAAIVDEHATRLRIDRDPVNVVEVAGTLLGGRAALAPRHQVLAVLVELHDARILIPVGYEERAVRQPRHERRAKEVLVVGARHVRLTKRLQDLLPVMGELEDRMTVVVDDPDVLLRVVRADVDRVGP